MEATTHTFETAGLGKAPFRYLGMRDTAANANDNGLVSLGTDDNGTQYHTTPGGTCAYCGKAITVLCSLESADGHKFHVGSDCVKKAGDAGMIRRVNADNRDRAKAKERDRIAEAKLVCGSPKVQDFLDAYPHPHAGLAKAGRSWYDYVLWAFKNSGHAGQLKVARLVEKVLAGKQDAPKWAS